MAITDTTIPQSVKQQAHYALMTTDVGGDRLDFSFERWQRSLDVYDAVIERETGLRFVRMTNFERFLHDGGHDFDRYEDLHADVFAAAMADGCTAVVAEAAAEACVAAAVEEAQQQADAEMRMEAGLERWYEDRMPWHEVEREREEWARHDLLFGSYAEAA